MTSSPFAVTPTPSSSTPRSATRTSVWARSAFVAAIRERPSASSTSLCRISRSSDARAHRPGRSALGARVPGRSGGRSRELRQRRRRPGCASRARRLVRAGVPGTRRARRLATHPRHGRCARRRPARARGPHDGPRAPDRRRRGRPGDEADGGGRGAPRDRARGAARGVSAVRALQDSAIPCASSIASLRRGR